MQTINERLALLLPGAMRESEFVSRSQEALAAHGFDSKNTIACVGLCRDELCHPLVVAIQEAWGEAFNFSSLAGMLTLGVSGFRAAHQHAPTIKGREHYLYIVMPHIGLNAWEEYGRIERAGRDDSTYACGALSALREELVRGVLDTETDPDNIEYSLLKQKLAPHLTGEIPNMLDLTKLMSELVSDDLERMIDLTVDKGHADYSVLTGVQIHRPNDATWIWPNRTYYCSQGIRHELPI